MASSTEPKVLHGLVRAVQVALDGRSDWLDEVVVALPEGEDRRAFKRALTEALAEAYLDGVNVRLVDGEDVALIECRFSARW